MIRSRSLPWLSKASALATLTHVQVPTSADGEEEIEVVVLESESDTPKIEEAPRPETRQKTHRHREERIHRFSSFSERLLPRERSSLGISSRKPRQPTKPASPTRIVKVFSDASLGQECSKLTIKSFDEEDKGLTQELTPRKFARRLSNPSTTWWKSNVDTDSHTNPPSITPPKPQSTDKIMAAKGHKKQNFLRRTLSGTFGNKKEIRDTDSMLPNAGYSVVTPPKSPKNQALAFLYGKENNSALAPERRIIRRTTSEPRVEGEMRIPSAVEYRTKSRDRGPSMPPQRLPRRNSAAGYSHQSHRDHYSSRKSATISPGDRGQGDGQSSRRSRSSDMMSVPQSRPPLGNRPYDEFEGSANSHSHDITALSTAVPESFMNDREYTNRYPPDHRSYPLILDERDSGPTQYQPPQSAKSNHRAPLMDRPERDRAHSYDHLSNATPIHSNIQRQNAVPPHLAERTTYDRIPTPYNRSPQPSDHSAREHSSESEGSESYVSFSDYESPSSQSSSSYRHYSDEEEVEVRRNTFPTLF